MHESSQTWRLVYLFWRNCMARFDVGSILPKLECSRLLCVRLFHEIRRLYLAFSLLSVLAPDIEISAELHHLYTSGPPTPYGNCLRHAFTKFPSFRSATDSVVYWVFRLMSYPDDSTSRLKRWHVSCPLPGTVFTVYGSIRKENFHCLPPLCV